jgi:hypothetical protein
MIARHEGFIRNESRLDTVQVGANLIPQGTNAGADGQATVSLPLNMRAFIHAWTSH